MILIALSKKGHTHWRLIDNHNKIHQYQTLSLNPFFLTSSFGKIDKNYFPPIDLDKIRLMYFYSSECTSEEKCMNMGTFLRAYIKNASIKVEDGLMAVARGQCGHEPGIAIILGSNALSCLYDGTNMTERTKAEEEEGSGSYLGKQLVQSYLNKTLPEDLVKLFINKYKPIGEDFQAIINKEILKEKEFLASLSPFLFHNISHPFIAEMVYNAFVLFFDKYICVYPGYKKMKIHFSGGVAFYYGNILREVANDKQGTIGSVVEVPVAGLTLYHLEE